MKRLVCAAALGGLCALPAPVSAAVTTFSDAAAFAAASDGLAIQLFDFESPPFPDAGGTPVPFTGDVGGVSFDTAIRESAFALSGSQVSLGSFEAQVFDFTGYGAAVRGFGFFEVDLVNSADDEESTNVAVTFADGSSESFDFGLDGAANLTPVFFGLLTDMSPVIRVEARGFRGGASSASGLDDLSVAATPIPLPAPGLLLAAALAGAGMLGAGSRRRARL